MKVINPNGTSDGWGFWLGRFSNSSDIMHQVDTHLLLEWVLSGRCRRRAHGAPRGRGGDKSRDAGTSQPHSVIFWITHEAGGPGPKGLQFGWVVYAPRLLSVDWLLASYCHRWGPEPTHFLFSAWPRLCFLLLLVAWRRGSSERGTVIPHRK